MSEGRIVVVRCVLFRAGRRFSGSLARKTVRRMTGKTGAVVDLRNPPIFARGVHLDHQAWPVRWVTIDGHVSREVGSRTVQPFGVELEPGHHLLLLLDQSHHLVKSAQVEVRQGAVTLVTVFPPTTFLVPSKRVRASPGHDHIDGNVTQGVRVGGGLGGAGLDLGCSRLLDAIMPGSQSASMLA